ncbi:hypothetical protein FN846DRAFT_1002557 [Sphaerosporella brunnea]|uniref:DUF2423 domain-containing protein n=1 Tax=Sphaerosporella brunnea TaxID=1250544 RepID=A0A5J5F4C5_9PEZI|nr:hypothetical protein FN846DRAFT_1002557 [Sphaerosporella brunnea]
MWEEWEKQGVVAARLSQQFGVRGDKRSDESRRPSQVQLACCFLLASKLQLLSLSPLPAPSNQQTTPSFQRIAKTMAKSARASVSKRNSAARRDTIYKPVEDERLQRLSEKLLEIAKAGVPTESTNPVKKDGEAMDVAEDAVKSTSTESEPSASKKKSGKFRVHGSRHARNTITFPSLRKNAGKNVGSKSGKSKRK